MPRSRPTGGALDEPGQRVRRAGLGGAGAARPRGRRSPARATGSRSCCASTPFDIVHVHEPFAPSVSSAALRHSYSLNVATFHAPQERVLSTQVARPLVEIFFGRLDARTVTTPATAELLERYFPGDYELVEPAGPERDWAQVAAELEALYRRLPRAPPRPRRQPRGARGGSPRRKLIEVDLHMHTDHSPDCATPVDVLLQTARDRGLGAIAITDHNEVSGRAGGAADRRGDGRHQGDRRRGGEDRRAGRGDRPLPRGEDPDAG